MLVEWYGQSAFRLTDGETTVVIDPFGDISEALAASGLQFDYPAIEVDADLLLITHEHRDHAGVEVVGGDPVVLRSTAGRLESPVGEVVAVASEHDNAAGTERGPNTIFVFDLGGVRVAHFGDFGQAAMRPEQVAAVGTVDLLFVPVGGGPTIGGAQAAEIAATVGARWVVPMHYRTPRVSFLDPADEFLAAMPGVHHVDGATFDTDEIPADEAALAVVPAAP